MMQRRSFLRNGLLFVTAGLFLGTGLPCRRLLTLPKDLPTIADSDIFNRLIDAIRHESPDTIESLVRKGANVNAKGGFCFQSLSTPLHYAAAFRTNASIAVLKCLVSFGADINAKDKTGNTPLHRVAWNGNKNAVEVVRFLISKGADVNIKNMNGYTPYDLAKIQDNKYDDEYTFALIVEYLSNKT